MKLLFNKRDFGWGNSYNIFDEQGKTRYTVTGDEGAQKLTVSSSVGEELGGIVRSGSKYELYIGDRQVGTVKKAFALFKTRLSVELRDWEVEGLFEEWEYAVRSRAWGEVGRVEKKIWKDTDCYAVEVKNPDLAIDALLVVLSIEALFGVKK